MEFVTKFNYVPSSARVYDTHSDTEQVGYRTVEQQVKALVQAGQRLDASRKGLVYDLPENAPESLEDCFEPIPDNEDIVDMLRAQSEALERINERAKAREEEAPKTSDEIEAEQSETTPQVGV